MLYNNVLLTANSRQTPYPYCNTMLHIYQALLIDLTLFLPKSLSGISHRKSFFNSMILTQQSILHLRYISICIDRSVILN